MPSRMSTSTRNVNATNGPARERAERYSKQLAELRAKAIAAQDRVTEFRQQNAMTEVDADKMDVEGAALNDLQQKLEAAQNQRRELESRQIEAHSSSDAVLGTESIGSLRAKLTGLEGQMAEARTTLGPKHPKVVELQSQDRRHARLTCIRSGNRFRRTARYN